MYQFHIFKDVSSSMDPNTLNKIQVKKGKCFVPHFHSFLMYAMKRNTMILKQLFVSISMIEMTLH